MAMEASDVSQDLHLGMAQNYRPGFRKQRKDLTKGIQKCIVQLNVHIRI